MRLSIRMALILVPATFLALTAAFVVASLAPAIGIVSGFKDVEAQDARDQLGEIRRTVGSDLDTLDSTARDWAHWDDTQAFVNGTNPDYVEVNLPPKSMAAYDLSFVLYLDAAGRTVYATGFDPPNETLLPLPAELQGRPSREALRLPDMAMPHGHTAGLVTLGGHVHMVSSWAILPTSEEGPSAGTMAWGRRIDRDYQELLEHVTRSDVHPVAWAGAAGKDAGAAGHLEVANDTWLDEVSNQELAAYTRMDDLAGQPALLLRVDRPRPILDEAYSSLVFAYLSASAVVALFVAAVVLLLRRHVTGRVDRLSLHMAAIRAGAAPVGNASVEGTDEVAELGREFDTLMAELDRRSQELERSNADLRRF